MNTYRIPRGNDFYIGIPMQVITGVNAGNFHDPHIAKIPVNMLQGVEITLKSAAVGRELEFRQHDEQKDTFIVKVYGDLPCGQYELTVKGWLQGRQVACRCSHMIEIVHEMMRWGVRTNSYYGEPYFTLEPQSIVFNGAIYPQFSLNPDDMCIYVNDSLEREWEIDDDGYLVRIDKGVKIEKEYQEPEWGKKDDGDNDNDGDEV